MAGRAAGLRNAWLSPLWGAHAWVSDRSPGLHLPFVSSSRESLPSTKDRRKRTNRRKARKTREKGGGGGQRRRNARSEEGKQETKPNRSKSEDHHHRGNSARNTTKSNKKERKNGNKRGALSLLGCSQPHASRSRGEREGGDKFYNDGVL